MCVKGSKNYQISVSFTFYFEWKNQFFSNFSLETRNHLDIIQLFDDWITGRTKILRENAYQLSKTQLEEKIQDRAMHVRDQYFDFEIS